MMLGKLSVPRCPTNLDDSGAMGLLGWLVVLGLRPFETVFQSILGRLPEKGRKKREMIDERKNVQTTPVRTYCKHRRPLPYSTPNK